MAVIVNGDGILTGVSSLTTALDDITSGRGTITGVTTVGTLQLGTGVSISSPRSQQAAIFTNNTEFFTVDDAGRVGIAITNPTTKFHVNGTSTFSGDVSIAEDLVHTGDTDTKISFGPNSIRLDTAGVLAVQVVNDQKVGFGTNNPQKQVDVYNATAGTIRVSNSSKSVDLIANSTGGLLRTIGSYPLVFNTNQTDRMTLDASGRLLLGTTTEGQSSADDLTIATSGNTGITIRSGTSNAGNIYFSDATSGTAEYAGYVSYSHSTNVLSFGTNDGTERARIDAQGRLQIGSTNNTATGTKFVVGAGNNITATALINTQDTDINALTLSNWDGSTTTNKVIVGFDNSGRGSFSMGMPAASADFTFTSSIDGASNERLRIRSTGYLNVADGGITCTDTGAGSGTSNLELQPYGTDGYINCTASGNLYTRMGSGYAIRTRIDSSGNFHVASGNIVMSTAGKGIDFSATSGSGTSELLNDYEEGSFTPALANGTGITVHNATYIKIGTSCTINVYVTISSNSNSSTLNFTGLPFTEANKGYALGAAYTQNTGATHVFSQKSINSQNIEVLKTYGQSITLSDVSGAYVLFSNTYFTT